MITRIIQDFPVGLGNDLCERKPLPSEDVDQIMTNKNNNLQADIVIFYKEQLSLVHGFY